MAASTQYYAGLAFVFLGLVGEVFVSHRMGALLGAFLSAAVVVMGLVMITRPK